MSRDHGLVIANVWIGLSQLRGFFVVDRLILILILILILSGCSLVHGSMWCHLLRSILMQYVVDMIADRPHHASINTIV